MSKAFQIEAGRRKKTPHIQATGHQEDPLWRTLGASHLFVLAGPGRADVFKGKEGLFILALADVDTDAVLVGIGRQPLLPKVGRSFPK